MKNKFMQRAIELSIESINSGGGPFGSVIAKGDKIISLECYEWSKRMQSRFTDNFTMSITTKKFQDYQQGITTSY